jgi:lysophospholipid acyltransferase (LPLAT)-like uncharacterized protein
LKIEGWRARWLIALPFPLLKLWTRTLRFEIEDRAGLGKETASERYIGALWHNRLLLIAHVVWRFFPSRRGGGALISASRDGAIIADIVERYGFEAVRGSSSRKGTSALLQLSDMVASGRDVLITPDGPRGPVYELGAGIIFLAQKTGTPVIPINMEYSSCWRVKSWDRFILPKPFSKVRVIMGSPHRVRPTATDEEFEAERLRLQETMLGLVEQR